MKIRILHILWEGIGGAERIVVDLTRQLDNQKYKTTVAILSKSGPTTDEIDLKRIRVVEFGCRSGFDLPGLTRFFAFLRDNSFHLVVNHGRTFGVNIALLVIRPRPILIYHEHGAELITGSIKTRLFYRFISCKYNALIALNKDTAKHMLLESNLPDNKIKIIENSVDTKLFAPKKEKKRTSLHAPFTVGTVARLVHQKDIPLFLNTAHILSTKYDNLHFIIVGDGPLRMQLEVMVQSYMLKNRVFFVGNTSNVAAYLRDFDLFLFTSRFEPFGITLIESLACQVPVVAVLPGKGGARSMLKMLPGVFLIPNRNPEAIADAISHLLGNPSRRAQMGQQGREYVLQHYSLEKYVEHIERLYSNLLDSRRNFANRKVTP